MATMVVLLRHFVKSRDESESPAKERSGKLAEQGTVNLIDLGLLCQSGVPVSSCLVQMVSGENL